MKVFVSCDSTCDLGDKLIKENNIHIMPLIVNLGDDTHYDNIDVTPKDIFSFVDKTKELPKTAARSIYEYEEHFKSIFEKGADAIIHISLSSEMSSTHQNSVIAASSLENVVVVDSKNLSSGHGLFALEAVKLAGLNLPLELIKQKLEQYAEKIQASFVISNLKYLYKGGRCSAVEMFGANLLKIKPSIHVVDGKMVVGKKYMGKFLDSIQKYTQTLLAENPNIDKENVFITYSSDKDNVANEVEKILKENGFKNIYKTFAGAVICCHCGPECMGVLFANK